MGRKWYYHFPSRKHSSLRAPSSKMADARSASTSTSVSDLAPELILQIFKSVDGASAITALNATSRKFYKVWRANAASISDAVFSRTIPCFDDAKELSNIILRTYWYCYREYWMVLNRNENLLATHAKALQYFRDIRYYHCNSSYGIIFHRPRPLHPYPAASTLHYVHSWYFFQIIIALANRGAATALFSRLSFSVTTEMVRMMQVFHLMITQHSKRRWTLTVSTKHKTYTGITVLYPRWRSNGWDRVDPDVERAFWLIDGFFRERLRSR